MAKLIFPLPENRTLKVKTKKLKFENGETGNARNSDEGGRDNDPGVRLFLDGPAIRGSELNKPEKEADSGGKKRRKPDLLAHRKKVNVAV